MTHITESYGRPSNDMECTNAEYWQLKAMFAQIGVELRMICSYQDTIKFQCRNAYRENLRLWDNHTPKNIMEMTNREVEEGRWCN